MASDIFLKMDDVKGESIDSKHKDEIDVLSWSWGLTQASQARVGGGSGVGKVDVHDITLTKFIDNTTPALAVAACTGQHFKEAVLTSRKAGGKSPVEYLKLTMKQVVVSSVSTGVSSGDDKPTETITLNFAEFKLTYTSQTETGEKAADVVRGWNIRKGEEAA